MTKYIILAVAALTLVACNEPTPEQKDNLKRALPDNCTVTEIGRYGSIDEMVIVTCAGYHTTSTFTYLHKSTGKTSETDRSAAIVLVPNV